MLDGFSGFNNLKANLTEGTDDSISLVKTKEEWDKFLTGEYPIHESTVVDVKELNDSLSCDKKLEIGTYQCDSGCILLTDTTPASCGTGTAKYDNLM